MALDANGNYYANMPEPAPLTTACSIDWCVGSGAPAADEGNDGDLRISRTTGTIYEKVDGAWVALPGGGGGGGANNQTATGTPIGNNIPDYIGQLCLAETSGGAPFDVYIATGLTNADWLQLLSGITP